MLDLVEIAEVGSLTASMASVDWPWDYLKLYRETGWRSPSGLPDIDPIHEALLLREALHEGRRTLEEGRFDGQFREWLGAAERQAGDIEMTLKNSDATEAGNSRSQLLGKSCPACHVRYRN